MKPALRVALGRSAETVELVRLVMNPLLVVRRREVAFSRDNFPSSYHIYPTRLNLLQYNNKTLFPLLLHFIAQVESTNST